MAKTRPIFLTGANAKIKVNGRTMAYCTDISYTIQVMHQTPKVLGMYEGTSVEPLGYNVSGSFRLIRYMRNAKDNISKSVKIQNSGNGVGSWGKLNKKKGLTKTNEALNGARAEESLSPGDLENAAAFDIEIYQKLYGAQTDSTDNLGVARIRNCRIVQADFSLSKRSAAVQTFNFVALYADEDTFQADFSGRGQQF